MSTPNVKTIQLTGLATSLALDKTTSRGLVLQVADDNTAKSVRVGTKKVVIGAGGECDLVLADRAVSRTHAEVLPSKAGVFVRDLGSTNGTFVQGARVVEAVVGIGNSFRVGETEIRVVDGGGPSIPPSNRSRFGGLIGESRPMREAFAVLELAAATEATVLLEGPSGTGKELTARAIHDHSPRASGPFVIFDCGTAQKELIASALMGHKKGAFTGADRDRPGAFVKAHGGTIFLDEIGELPLDSQTQLLRALESGHVIPVGGDATRPIDCRVVAATNRDLFEMVEQKTFRLDLFHRLAVVHIRLPSLNERIDDLPALIRGIYEGRGLESGPIRGENLERLSAHHFEGNVRELRNILERSLVLAGKNTAFETLPLWLGPSFSEAAPSAMTVDTNLPFKDAKERVVDQFEAQYLPELMTRFDDNISQAARHAGLSRRHLRALLVKHGLKDNDS